ncbi:hypothetical protein KAR91_76695 [Candidatus Pacearchaeota archaeon]|nr:hypothetical protein [Candidatus Pacearchaeota archaeon]
MEEKLDKIVCLIETMVEPIKASLFEIKKSHHSRIIILVLQGVVAITVCIVCICVLNKIQDVVDRMELAEHQLSSSITSQALQRVDTSIIENQLEELINLAQENASSDQIVEKLYEIEKIAAEPNITQIRHAVESQPKVVKFLEKLKEEKLLLKMDAASEKK